jgi:HAD superfamily hydrolase (TIGR01549 family)
VLWDFDGTLADTRERNLSVNRRIVEEITGTPWQEVAGLTSVEAYEAAWRRVGNWQELYTAAFGLTDQQCAEAAKRWAPCQLDDVTPVPVFDGIAEALDELQHFPQAVVSQNDRTIISQVLRDHHIDRFFTSIIGYSEVPIHRQKPRPDGLVRALDDLGVVEPGSALYIGDHETDVVCAENANLAFSKSQRELQVIPVAAHFLNPSAGSRWSVAPEYTVERPEEIAQLVRDLCVESPDG